MGMYDIPKEPGGLQFMGLKIVGHDGSNLAHTLLFSSVQFIHSVVSDSLRPHELQHAWPLPVHHQLPEFTHTHVRVGGAFQPSRIPVC